MILKGTTLRYSYTHSVPRKVPSHISCLLEVFCAKTCICREWSLGGHIEIIKRGVLGNSCWCGLVLLFKPSFKYAVYGNCISMEAHLKRRLGDVEADTNTYAGLLLCYALHILSHTVGSNAGVHAPSSPFTVNRLHYSALVLISLQFW